MTRYGQGRLTWYRRQPGWRYSPQRAVIRLEAIDRYNDSMKIWIVLLSLLSAAIVWRWGPHRRHVQSAQWRNRARQIGQSLIAGVAVYFSVMMIAALYLTFIKT